ncbi:carbohydrate ABC transporter permease [Metabacillus halosaccharovorans]|uniref:carbohydrate ABC transporter permease n=1 Tax=Metabacillus halosaccharovorans TaxID=930124 RepID=UPI001C1F5789|nr:carbohydrate ABC transporter permease [Metabacillus halosaccharovorans]MBU7591327.1 carbohydrate ABC transporter permease [Metabacillus halosaccharovorans]MCM3440304.1 carbohydrate ABC transporter permease [Metabacillus halosaccharovorans]
MLKVRKRNSLMRTREDVVFDTFNIMFMILLSVIMLYPFINQIALSLNAATDSVKGGIYLWPREFTWRNYEYVFSQASIIQAIFVSVARTVVGTGVGLLCTAMVAYAIAQEKFVFKKSVTIIFIMTMYFNGGLIPGYLLMRDLHLIGTFWVYILPGLISAFNLIIMRSFIEGLPKSLFEQARIDGAGDFRVFFQIVLPLSLPVLATVALFVAVGQWNQWFDVFLYNSSNENLTTLQYELMKILQNTATSNGDWNTAQASGERAVQAVTPKSIQATMTIVASLPIICVYPFLQKYFVKGMTLGAVK